MKRIDFTTAIGKAVDLRVFEEKKSKRHLLQVFLKT